MAENRELALVLKLVADEFQRELRNSQSQLSVFNNFIKDWRTQLVAAGTALFAVAKSTANFGEEALKGAQKIGTTVEAYTALSHAAKMADLDNQQLITGMKSLAQNMVEAQRGTGDGAAVFQRMGVAAVTAAGQLRPTQQVLLDLADVFAKSADGAGKTEAAVKLFGKAGIDLIPFLNQGKAGITALMAEAQKLGVVMSKEDAEAANRFNDEIKKLDAQLQGLTLSVGTTVLPMLTDMLKLLRDVGDATKNAGQEMAGFSRHLSENFGKTGAGQGLMDVFSAMGFGHRKGEGPGTAEKALMDALGIKPGGAASGGTGSDVKLGIIGEQKKTEVLKTQAQIGKEMLAVFLERHRMLEIEKRLLAEAAEAQRQVAEAAEDAAIEQAKGARIVSDTQKMLAGAAQEQLGRQIVQQTQAQLSIDEQLRRENMTFFDSWKEGMQQYVQDTKSGLGLAADLARRTAQMMEQSFKTFFFDLFEGRIQSLQDALKGVLSFITQIASTIASQLATKAVLGAFGFTANAGGMIQQFANGGPVLGTGNRDTVPALLTPGEFVLSRQDVGEIKRGIGGGPQIIINNYGQNEVSATSGRGPDGRQAVYVTVRDMVRGMIQGGEMDSPMSRRFGMTPAPGRR